MLFKHLEQKHKAVINQSQLHFTSLDNFLSWKEEEESQNHIYYSKQTSTKGTKMYYICQKDGHSMPHRSKGNEQRKTVRRNKKGVVKTGMFCPSRMICKVDQKGAINVNYIQTHSHPIEFKDTLHHPIPKTILEQVKSKLLLGASVDHIHKDLREGRDSRDNREEPFNIKKKTCNIKTCSYRNCT